MRFCRRCLKMFGVVEFNRKYAWRKQRSILAGICIWSRKECSLQLCGVNTYFKKARGQSETLHLLKEVMDAPHRYSSAADFREVREQVKGNVDRLSQMSGEGSQQIQSRDLTTLPFLPLQIPDINKHLYAPPHNSSMGLWGVCLNSMKACTLCGKKKKKKSQVVPVTSSRHGSQ